MNKPSDELIETLKIFITKTIKDNGGTMSKNELEARSILFMKQHWENIK